jgi:glycosyltransferase involved in cell wall biosynthesis
MTIPVTKPTVEDQTTQLTGHMTRLTVICPVHNEQAAIPLFVARLMPVLSSLSGRYESKLFFIDNGSSDRSHEVIRELRAIYENIYVLGLSRNFGYQRSLDCALRAVSGEVFVIIDVDCEDPPEMIEDFIDQFELGFDVVYGERVDRPESLMLRTARKLFYRLTRLLADDDFVLDMAEFCLLSEQVRDAIIRDRSTFPFIRASIGRVGFRRKNIPYRRQTRIAGETHYNVLRMIFFGLAGILSSSTLPLRMVVYACPLWIVAMGWVAFVAVNPTWVLGFLGFSYCGLALATLSVYMARAYKDGLSRPNAFIDRRRTVTPDDAVPKR